MDSFQTAEQHKNNFPVTDRPRSSSIQVHYMRVQPFGLQKPVPLLSSRTARDPRAQVALLGGDGESRMQGMYSLNESHNFLPGAAPPLPQTLQQPHLTRTLPRCPARANWYHHPLGLPVNPCSADEHAIADHSFPCPYWLQSSSNPRPPGGRGRAPPGTACH